MRYVWGIICITLTVGCQHIAPDAFIPDELIVGTGVRNATDGYGEGLHQHKHWDFDTASVQLKWRLK